MAEQVLGRRERKKQATRTALSEAALRLCGENGIENVTVERIADEADVSLRTFFNYFSSKEEAVVAGDMVTAEAFVAAFRACPAEETLVEALRHAVHSVLDEEQFRQRTERFHVLRQTRSLLPFQLAAFAEQEKALASAVSERTGVGGAADLYPALVAAGAMAMLRVAMQRWLTELAPDGRRYSLPRLVDAALEQFAAGLATRTAEDGVPDDGGAMETYPL